jgi:hypothetical protein
MSVYDPSYWGNMTAGNVITAVDQVLYDKTGYFWYMCVFGAPVIMIWLKTESITLSTMVLMWTIALYGTLMNPSGIMGEYAAVFVAAGMVALFIKALWR